MKFICEKNTLLKEISIAQEIIGTKQSFNALSNLYLEASDDTLLIKATDITVYFETKVPVSVVESGSAVVKGSLFLNVLNNIPEGELEFEQVEDKIIVKPVQIKGKYELKTNSQEQYPEFPVPGSAVNFEIPAKDFKEMITQTIFAVSSDESRFLMTGIYFEKSEGTFVMVSTDGRRMAYITKPAEGVQDFAGIIIPAKILAVAQKNLGEEGVVSIGTNEKNIFISFGTYSFSSGLIEGKFPDYKRVIPSDHDKQFSFNREEMLASIKRVAVVVEKHAKRIYLKLTPGAISVYGQESDEGSADFDISSDYNGEETQISLNYQYLEEPLRAIKEDEAIIHFNDPTKAITLKSVPEKEFFHIIMPMQTEY